MFNSIPPHNRRTSTHTHTSAGAPSTAPAFFRTAAGKAATAFATGLGAPAIFAQSFFACAAGKAPTTEGMLDIILVNADIAAISPSITPRTFLRFGWGVAHIGNAPLVDGGACTTFPVRNRGGGGHDGRIMRAGCEGLVVLVGCGPGCEGCVGWLFVLQAPTIPVGL